MQHSPWLLLGLLLPVLALAAGDSASVADIQATMVVTGTITVNPEGGVLAYKLDKPKELPAGVVEIIKATVPAWKFKPVLRDGKAVTAEADMSLRIVAHARRRRATRHDRRNRSSGQGDAVAIGTVFQPDPSFVLLTPLGNAAG